MLTIAVKAARRAGSIINRAARDVDQLTITRKRHNDFVTEVDKAAEATIIDTIRDAYPDHAILAEESGRSAGTAEYTWVIDPLDGTTNFIHGFPQYAVSIAVMHKDEPHRVVGRIYVRGPSVMPGYFGEPAASRYSCIDLALGSVSLMFSPS